MKIFKVFKILNSEDFRKIKKMLRSPFFSSKRNLETLFDVLHFNFLKGGSLKKITEKDIYEQVFPGEDFSKPKLRNLRSDLLKLIEDYLVFKESKLSETERSLALLEIYLKRGALELFQTTEKKLLKMREESVFKDSIYLKNSLELNRIRMNKMGYSDFFQRIKLLHESYFLNDILNSLNKRKIEIELTSLKNMNIVAPLPSENPFEKNILFEIYEAFEKMYQSKKKNQIVKTKELLFSNLTIIRKSVAFEILLELINFTYRMMRINDKKFSPLVFDFYRSGVDEQLFIQNGKISVATFSNIVAAGAKNGELEWVKNFIFENEQFLPNDERQVIKNYSLAQIYFNEKKYKTCLDTISGLKAIKLKHPTMRLAAKLLTIRAGFEHFLTNENYDDQLLINIQTFERWNYRNAEHKNFQACLNFTAIIKRMVSDRIENKLADEKRIQLLKRLNAYEEVISRGWLLAKLKK